MGNLNIFFMENIFGYIKVDDLYNIRNFWIILKSINRFLKK